MIVAFKPPIPDSPPEPDRLTPPIAARPDGALPAEHAYRQDEDTPLRTDEQGRIWFREEVRKPATPAPRARRVLKYIDPGTTTKTIVNGRYIESFEEAGNPFDPEVGKRFLDEILSRGGERPALENFKAFRGREPSPDALLRHNGMVVANA